MLSLYFPVFFSFFFNYFFLLSLFFTLLNKSQYVFYKVWAVFFYLMLQGILLGFFGEDFFVVLLLAAEIPVFFSFFFFCVTKTKTGITNKKIAKLQNKNSFLFIFVSLLLYIVFPEHTAISQFTYFLPKELLNTPQRSDFFLFYFSYFIMSPSIVVYIGLLISAATLILLFFTFKNQLNSATAIIKNKNISWVRTQDSNTQNNQKRSFVFFKI